MNTINVCSYEIKNARNKEKIPVVNGVHLHSSYDPSKEAASFIEQHAEVLKTKNDVLVFGLGFGYHVNELARTLTSIHGKKYNIVVIEPNNETYQECMASGLLHSGNITVYTGTDPKDYYIHQDLTHFLLRKPAIIAHPPSFNLYQLFFKSFLSYEAPKTIGKMTKRLSSKEIEDYLSTFSPDATLNQAADMVFSQNALLKELDFLLLALRTMTSSIARDSSRMGDN
jgi:hypothetical protein